MELAAPAGNMEKLRCALIYGADAVYAGAERFSLRARADNFSFAELGIAVREARHNKKRFYLAINAFCNDAMLHDLREFLEALAASPRDTQPDALIISDLGAMRVAARVIPQIPIHISTQANTLNAEAARFYHEYFGARRIILARELSLAEIAAFARAVPELEIEVFAHGAMCVAYSGRCILSSYLTSPSFLAPGEALPGNPDRIRSASYGDCAHACRWSYSLVEEKREGVVLHIGEDAQGTTLLSSRDLALIDHLAELRDAGVNAVKIEGRMKSLHYTAVTAGVYRAALDALAAGRNPSDQERAFWREELQALSRRELTTGFLFPDNRARLPSRGAETMPRLMMAIVLRKEESMGEGFWRCRAANALRPGAELSAIMPGMIRVPAFAYTLFSPGGGEISLVRAGEECIMRSDAPLAAMAILRQAAARAVFSTKLQ
ncbi:MAG: U32 family peptidase [Spirochaetota bacterium]|jgi:putative protease|nr:U32 family peptidase [Spirochaetota bacterium]